MLSLRTKIAKIVHTPKANINEDARSGLRLSTSPVNGHASAEPVTRAAKPEVAKKSSRLSGAFKSATHTLGSVLSFAKAAGRKAAPKDSNALTPPAPVRAKTPRPKTPLHAQADKYAGSIDRLVVKMSKLYNDDIETRHSAFMREKSSVFKEYMVHAQSYAKSLNKVLGSDKITAKRVMETAWAHYEKKLFAQEEPDLGYSFIDAVRDVSQKTRQAHYEDSLKPDARRKAMAANEENKIKNMINARKVHFINDEDHYQFARKIAHSYAEAFVYQKDEGNIVGFAESIMDKAWELLAPPLTQNGKPLDIIEIRYKLNSIEEADYNNALKHVRNHLFENAEKEPFMVRHRALAENIAFQIVEHTERDVSPQNVLDRAWEIHKSKKSRFSDNVGIFSEEHNFNKPDDLGNLDSFDSIMRHIGRTAISEWSKFDPRTIDIFNDLAMTKEHKTNPDAETANHLIFQRQDAPPPLIQRRPPELKLAG